MGKRIIPRSSLTKIKEQYRDSKKAEIEETVETTDTTSSSAVSIEEAKLIAQDNTVVETGFTPKELKKNKRVALKNIKDTFKSEKKIKAEWNFSIGDLVEFQDRTDKTMHIGIVVDFIKSEKHDNRHRAKSDGSVLLYSSCGRIWKKPAAVRKIE
jgi:hypothetical protein